MIIDHKTIAVGALAAVGLYWFAKREGTAALKAVGNAVNPVSNENIFYKGVGAIGKKLTGDEHFNLGGWIYDKLNSNGDTNHPEDGIGIPADKLKTNGMVKQ